MDTWMNDLNASVGLLTSAAAPIVQMGYNGRSWKRTKELYEMQRDDARASAEWQNQTNIANWQMQNEYNTPANQVQRLIDAGLNPNLMYGNGTAATGNAGDVSSAKMDVPSQSGFQYGQVDMARAGQGILSASQQMLQGDALASQIDYQNAQTRLVNSQVNRNNVQTLQDVFNYQYSKDTRNYNITRLLGEIFNQDVRSENLQASTDESRARTTNLQAELPGIIANAQLLQGKLKMQPLESVMLSKQISEVAARINNIYIDTLNKTEDNKTKVYENDFLSDTYDNRVKTVQNVLVDSFYRAENGRLQFNLQEAKNHFFEIMGTEEGAPIWSQISGLIGTLMRRINNAL